MTQDADCDQSKEVYINSTKRIVRIHKISKENDEEEFNEGVRS